MARGAGYETRGARSGQGETPGRLDTPSILSQSSGMEADAFHRSLRAFTGRVPFQSFSVELISGSQFTVDHPEALVVRGGLAVYVSPEGTPTLFDHQGVSRLLGA